METLPVPAILAMILGGWLIAWTIRKVRPGMPLLRKAMFVVGGGIVLGGVIYGMVLGQ